MSVAILIYLRLISLPVLRRPAAERLATFHNSADVTVSAAHCCSCNPDVARDTICRGHVRHLLVLFYL